MSPPTVFELIDLKSLVFEPEDPGRCRGFQTIAFQEVGFTYVTKVAPVRRCSTTSIDVWAGSRGRRGKRIGQIDARQPAPRFFDPDRGACDRRPGYSRVRALADLRGRIGIVTQETLLFDDAIDIRYGRFDSGREAVDWPPIRPLSQFLDQMPERLETRVGRRGQPVRGTTAADPWRGPSCAPRHPHSRRATSASTRLSERLIHQTLESFVRIGDVYHYAFISESILKLNAPSPSGDGGRLWKQGNRENDRIPEMPGSGRTP